MYRKTLVISALVGFIVGFFWKSDWQWTLEAAQIVSGVVSLPQTNPTAIFSYHAYAPFLIWPQAGLLRLGISSEYISIVFSGLQSALSFMSVSALLYVLSKNWIVAIATPIILTFFPVTIFTAHSYDVFFPTSLNNGGLLAFYAVIFAIAALARGHISVFLLILGVLPALHTGTAMGVWLGTIVYFLIADEGHKKQFRLQVRWFVYGVVFFVITALAHRLLSGSFFEQATVTGRQIIDYFITYVDGHRRPKLPPLSWTQRLEYFEPEAMLWVALWLFFGRYKKFISKEAHIILKLLGAMSVVGFVMTILWEFYSASFPSVLKTVMYARWLNFDSIILPLFMVGIMSYQRVWRSVVVVSMLFFMGIFGVVLWRFVFIILICCLEAEIHAPTLMRQLDNRVRMKTLGIISLLFCVLVFGNFIKQGLRPNMRVSDAQAMLMSTLARGKGLIVSSYQALPLLQVMTTRGQVFNLHEIDNMIYVPSMADESEKILQEIYGLSLYDKEIWPSLDVIQTVWETRSLTEWQQLKERYGVTSVLSSKYWSLRLPKQIESETLTVYYIP